MADPQASLRNAHFPSTIRWRPTIAKSTESATDSPAVADVCAPGGAMVGITQKNVQALRGFKPAPIVRVHVLSAYDYPLGG